MAEIHFETGTKAMVIVPHQDDELNCAGNLLLWLKKQDIKTYIVYSTNGDWRFPADQRYEEASAVCAKLGIEKDHIIFLGYGDSLNSDRHDHLFYQTETPAVSPAGHTHTYGGIQFSDFAFQVKGEHSPYTFPALCSDVKLLLETYLPDLVVCVDLDEHADHRALALAFDHAMGMILKERDDYHPQVLKRFAYCLAYSAKEDFYEGDNLPETKRPVTVKTDKYAFDIIDTLDYGWEKRIRIPAVPEALDRVLRKNEIAGLLFEHKSQNIVLKAERIINSDEIYWERRTDSISYQARVTASGGDASYVNDFMVIGLSDIDSPVPAAGHYLWKPDDNDPEKNLVFEWDKEQEISKIRLYGNVENTGRILEASVILDNGFSVRTGPFPENGKPLDLVIPLQQGVRKAEVRIERTEGKSWGIGECEFYASHTGKSVIRSFAKLTADGNFAEVYNLSEDENEVLIGVYVFGDIRHGSAEVVSGNAVLKESLLQVDPEETDLRIVLKDEKGEVLDSLQVHRLTKKERTARQQEKALDEAWLKEILLKKKAGSFKRIVQNHGVKGVVKKLTGGK